MDNIAIIMATYNGEKYIKQQIDSILENTYQDYTIHICDDCSNDETIHIVEDYICRYPEKIVLHRNEKNLRVIKNFLHWTTKIEANYYMFSDQDDFWKKDKIKKSFDYIKSVELEEPNKPVAIFTDAEVVDEELKTLHESFQRHEHYDTSKLKLEDLLMENKLIGCTVMFNKLLQDMISKEDCFPEEIIMHDWWVGLIAAAFGKVAYLDEPLIKYRQHGNNEVGSLGMMGYIWKNVLRISLQRQILYSLFKQGASFLDEYECELSWEKKELLRVFSTLYNQNWIKRHVVFICVPFRKTGLIRNIGTFILL